MLCVYTISNHCQTGIIIQSRKSWIEGIIFQPK